MTSPTRTTLEAARALIADEKAWGHGWGQKGRRCAVHAVWDACDRKTETPYYRAIAALRQQIGNASLSTFNDTHDHADIVEVFDRAIGASS